MSEHAAQPGEGASVALPWQQAWLPAIVLMFAAGCALWAMLGPRVLLPESDTTAALQRELIIWRKRLRLLERHTAGMPLKGGMQELRLLIHEWSSELRTDSAVQLLAIRLEDRDLIDSSAMHAERFEVLRLDLSVHLPGAVLLLDRLERLRGAAASWPMAVHSCTLEAAAANRTVRASCSIDFYHDDAPRSARAGSLRPHKSVASTEFALFPRPSAQRPMPPNGSGSAENTASEAAIRSPRARPAAHLSPTETPSPPAAVGGANTKLQYNGFVQSASGIQYLIDGRPWRPSVSGITSIEPSTRRDQLLVRLVDGSRRKLVLDGHAGASPQ